jgi:hypothetical protein
MEYLPTTAASGGFALLMLILGVAAGMWGYRYWMRRDPESLERVAAELKRLRNSGE